MAAEDYLKSKGKVGPSAAARSKEVVEFLRHKISSGELHVDLSPGTILSYLSHAANRDTDSAIVSGGSWGGYWVDLTADGPQISKPIETAKIKSGLGKQVSFSEKQLYPLVELWLSTKGYVSKDVSTLKSGGKWGNPDIIGINRVELFGSVEIEIASCEVKLSDQSWESFIFEAISHKRASNRSWFCYRVPVENAPLPKGMEYYAERYKVGIVQIVLTDEEMIKVKQKESESIDLLEKVKERVPAIYDNVPLREKRDLMDRANIKITVAF
jgi:hypothetical protein